MLRRATKITIEVLAVILTGLAVAVGAAAWRLSSGPVSLQSLTPYIERAMTPSSGQFKVKVGQTVLRWGGWERPVVIYAVDVQAIQPDGRVLVRVPEATLQLSARALMRGVVAPTRLVVRRASLQLQRDETGRFDIGLQGAEGKGEVSINLLVDSLLSEQREGPLSYLKSISIVDGKMTIRDRGLGRSWHAPKTNLLFAKGPNGLQLRASITVDVAGREVRLSSVGAYHSASGTAALTVGFTGLEPALFAQLGRDVGLFDLGNSVRIPLDGRIFVSLDKSGRLARMAFELSGKEGMIVLPKAQARSLRVKSVSLKGLVGADFKRVKIDEFTADLGGPVVSLRGEITGLDGRAHLRMSAGLRNILVDDLGIYWPAGIAEGGRRWVTENVSKGRLPQVEANIEARLGGGRKAEITRLRGAFLYERLRVVFMEGMPPVEGVTGTGTFNTKGFDFHIRSGRLAGLTVEPSMVRLVGIDKPHPRQHRAIIDSSVRGPLTAALKLLDRKPFGYASKVGVSPKSASGEAVIRLKFDFPMLNALTMDEVDITSRANVRNFRWRKGLYGVDLTNGELTLDIDKSQMVVKGRVKVGTERARVNWIEKFADTANVSRKITIEGEVNDQIRRAFGLVVKPFVEGPLKVRVQLTKIAGSHAEDVTANIDLRQATLSAPFLGWRKSAGVPGRARISVRVSRGKIVAVRAMSLDAAGLKAKGRASMAAGGKSLKELNLSRVSLGKTSVALIVRGRPKGGFDVMVKGPSIDGARFFNEQRKSPPKTSKPAPGVNRTQVPSDISLQFAVERVYFGKGRFLSRVVGRAARIRGIWSDVHFDGIVDSGRPVKVRFAQRGPGRALWAQSPDAGGVLRSLNIMDGVVGGRLDIRGSIVDRKFEPFEGRVRVTDYTLIEAPILKEISQKGELKNTSGALARPKGTRFKEFVAPFTYRDGRLIVRGGRAVGDELGVTFQGRIDLRDQRLEVDGTVVPVYTLNSLLGKLPVLGTLLVGEKHGGVFAASYTAEGPLSKPKLTVHPLSVLTPPMLRGLWRKFKTNPPGSAEVPFKRNGNGSSVPR